MSKIAGLTEGRIVHYVLPKSETCREPGAHRPAIIVRVCPSEWGYPVEEGRVNLHVFTDYQNDFSPKDDGFNGSFWATSVAHDSENKMQGTWHFIEPAY